MNPGPDDNAGADASPTITGGTGTAAAGTDRTITATTNRADLRYVVSVTDQGPPVGAPVNTTVVPAANGDMAHTIPGANLVSGHTYAVVITVHPSDGATPPHHTTSGTITVP